MVLGSRFITPNSLEKNKDESADNTLHREIADDSDKSFENNSDSEYTKSSESIDDDKKEI